MLTEKHICHVLLKFLLTPVFATQAVACAGKENIWALFKSITQVVKKICSHAI